ncbi:MAG: DNA translocase FtsK 4TM domain-containing protein, partial [Sutterellaceae bacterium]|nr:DNA translocase FtsK 4TM domain-containing protein [Sutterellaceae bacterium]
MRKNKKPAIATEWREHKEAQERQEQEQARLARKQARAAAWAKFSGGVRHILTSMGWLFALVLGTLLAATLLSYTPSDPGFSSTGTQSAQNICGILGAWTADCLYWLFGRSAWWIVGALFCLGVQLVRVIWAKTNGMTYQVRPVAMLFGLAVLLAASVGLECLQFGYLSENLPLGAGGLLGQFVAQQVTPYGGVWGSTFVLFILVLVGMSYVFAFSWFDLAERIGALLELIAKTLASMKFKRKPKAESVEAEVLEKKPLAIEPAVKSERTKPRIVKTPKAAAPVADNSAKATKPTAKPKSASKGAADGRISPDLDLLEVPPAERQGITEEAVEATSRMIETKLKSYRIDARVVGAQAGPVITQYWLELAPGVKGSQVEDIRKDLTRALSVPSVRVVPVIPGKPYMGLEIPNGMAQRMAVYLSEIIGSPEFESAKSALSLALGKDIAGRPVVIDLAKLPHLLVGGTTGSGKSVCINTMILSLIYKSDPDHLRLVLIDPKTVEFSLYEDIPHLLCPVVTDMNKASQALNWLVQEMDHRYALMSKIGVRSFESYNDKVNAAIASGKPIMDPFDVTPENPEPHTPLKPFAYIVCFIDELADLMLVNRKQVEAQIMRLAQKARAAGIHLVLATQRPSVDIVTPLIKANIVARICFQVGSRFDSGVVLDENGAQELLGRGDMLFKRPGQSSQRIQGCMVEEDEVLRVVEKLKELGKPEYIDAVT